MWRQAVFQASLLLLLLLFPCFLSAQEPSFGGEVVLQDLPPGEISNPMRAATLVQRQKAALLFPRLLRSGLENPAGRSFIIRILPRQSDNRLTLFLRTRDTNPVGKLISPLDIEAMLTQYLHDEKAVKSLQPLVLRLKGAKEVLAGEADRISGLTVHDDEALTLAFTDERMMPESVFSSLILSGSRYYVEPAYLATDRGPFFRTSPGVYTANLQYCFGRPYIDRILLGRQNGGTANPGDRVVLNLENLLRGDGPEDGNQVVYPGKCCVYVCVNPDSGTLDSAAKRRFVLDQVDAQAMVTIFFAGEAELLSRIIPDEYIAFEALDYEAPESTGWRPEKTLVIAFPRDEIRLKLVAERLQVDLLVSNVDSRLVEYDGSPPAGADLVVSQELVSSQAPGLTFWNLLSGTLATGQVFEAPWIDELAWFLATEKLNNEQAWIKPLFQAGFTIRVPARLKGVRLFDDGTLDFEDAWIEPYGPER